MQVKDIPSLIIVYKVISVLLPVALLLLEELIGHVASPILLIEDVVEGLLLGGAVCQGWWLLW